MNAIGWKPRNEREKVHELIVLRKTAWTRFKLKKKMDKVQLHSTVQLNLE